MIPMLIARLVTLGIPAKFAKYALFGGLALLVLILLGTAKCSYDKGVIRKHDAATTAAIAQADQKANDAAAIQRTNDAARVTQETDQLDKVQSNVQQDPQSRRVAFYRCLSLQQRARQGGLVAPTCV